jgi:SAM-dependent methyltransferase
VSTQTTGWSTIEELCDRHLAARPSPAALEQMKKVEGERPQVRAFVARSFRMMEISRFRAVDIAPNHAWTIGVMMPGLLPDAWGGSIPPYTWENRHKRIDAYLAANPWTAAGPGTVFLEMGCGFPPKTAMDVARAHADWQVVGADPCFDEFLLYDEHGNYACLNHDGDIRYFHAASGNFGAFQDLYGDKAATLNRFSSLFQKLLPNISRCLGSEANTIEENGARLIRHPLRLYETPNLRFVQAGIDDEFAPVDILRCFNVLGYFDAEFRQQTKQWALRTLRPGGMFICGRDSACTAEAAYSVYREEDGNLARKEFAISIDNVRNFTTQSWFSMRENVGEAWFQARLVGMLRGDPAFRGAYDSRYDALLEEKRLFVRDSNGFLVVAPHQRPQAEWNDAVEEILVQLEQEGFAERAAMSLRKSGLHAWVNQAGHVAVDSPP